jgi:O-antigen/teichoic acid export membrane protein
MILSLLADLGIDSIVLRTFAPEQRSTHLPYRAMFTARLLSALAATVLAAAVVWAIDMDGRTTLFAAITLLVPRSLTSCMENYLKARLRQAVVAVVTGSISAVTVAGALAALWYGGSLDVLFLVLSLIEVARVVAYLAVIGAEGNAGVRPIWISGRQFLGLLRISLAFAALGLISYAGGKADIILIGVLRGSGDAGIFAAADRFLLAGNLLAFSMYGAMLPTLSGIDDQERHRELVRRLLAGAVGIGVFAGGVLWLAAPLLIRVTFGFSASIPLLEVLSLSVVPLLCNTVLGAAIFSRHGERAAVAVLGTAMIANLCLNALLIPPLGPAAAAAVAVGSDLLISAGYGALYFSRMLT